MRRRVLLASLVACVAADSAAAKHDKTATLEPLPATEFTLEHARHLLMRAGFGGTLEEAEKLHARGLDGAVAWLVDYEQRPDVVGPITVTPVDRSAYRNFRQMSDQERRRVRQQIRRRDQTRFNSVRRWWTRRMLETERPLEEKMTLFWHGHFTTSYRDVRNARRIHDQNELLRQHATGNFGELLHEISKDPAMLDYLDNNQNRKGRPNENYAREVMELFTLGVGNYTEQDIKEAARSFTGFTFSRRDGQFRFNRFTHDTGRKTVFGKTGRFDGDDICDLLLKHEACAPYIAGKIFAWFGYADVEPQLRKELAGVLAGCNFEVKPLLRRIFKSKAFYSQKARATMVKSPTVLLVSTVRMLGMKAPPGDLVAYGAQRLGQSLLMPPNVKGWEEGVSWITTASLLERNNLCGQFVRAGAPSSRSRGGNDQMMDRTADRNRSRRQRFQRARNSRFRSWRPQFNAMALAAKIGAKSAEELVDGLSARLLFTRLGATTRQNLIAFVTGADGSLPLDPGKMKGAGAEAKLRKLIHLIMSTPEFQVC